MKKYLKIRNTSRRKNEINNNLDHEKMLLTNFNIIF